MPTAKVGDVALWYEDDDYADPWVNHETVFIQHGFGRNSNFFRAWVPWLARRFRVIRMDLRGHGASSDPGPGYRFTKQDFHQDLLGLLDTLRIDKVHYIGESIGGLIGATAAAQYPERFRSVTLISTPLRIPEDSQRLARSLGYDSTGDAILKLGMRQWWMTQRTATLELTGNAAMDDYFAAEFARTPAHIGHALTLMDDNVFDLEDCLPRITAPLLLLVAGNASKTPREAQADMLRRLPDGRMKVYEGAKHSMYHLTPDPLAQDTLAFIRGLG